METLFGIELGSASKVIIALILVLLLIAIATWVIRQFGAGRIATSGGRGRQQRLAVLDSAVVDARRRLVLIRRDNVEHLLLIGGPSDVVVEPNIVRAQPLGGARPSTRTGGFEMEEGEATLIPETEPEPARPAAAAPAQPARAMPRAAPQRMDPQYADMAQRLEAALRKPVPEADLPRPAPAPTPRAPEPRPLESRPAPAPRPAPAVLQPAPRAPEPRAVEPRAVEPPRPAAAAPAQPPQQAPQHGQPAKQETAADIFGSLEEEMASLLRPGKKERK